MMVEFFFLNLWNYYLKEILKVYRDRCSGEIIFNVYCLWPVVVLFLNDGILIADGKKRCLVIGFFF